MSPPIYFLRDKLHAFSERKRLKLQAMTLSRGDAGNCAAFLA